MISPIDPSAQQRASADARGPERKPRRLKLTVVKGFRKKEVEKLAQRDLAPGTRAMIEQIPVGRIGRPDEVAAAIAFS